MERSKIHSLLHPYFDGELDFSESLIFEEHLSDCSDCSHALEEQKKLRVILEQSSLRYTAPKKLRLKVLSLLNKKESSRRVTVQWNWRIYGIAASITIVLLGLWMFIPKNSSNLQVGVTNEIVSSHIRSLMVSHLFDVASSDQHTVKPWFAGKLDFSPIVKDLPEKNFQLIGGRLDYIGGRTVAVVVYQYQKHIINVFEWTVNDNQYQTRIVEHDKGFNIIGDHSGEINFWVVSDLNTEELSQLVDPLK